MGEALMITRFKVFSCLALKIKVGITLFYYSASASEKSHGEIIEPVGNY